MSGAITERHGKWLDVALVNNMPDAALRQTERQFTALLAVSTPVPVRVWRYTLPTVPRTDLARSYLAGRYFPVDQLWESPCTAVVVTGCEPVSADLTNEPYWPDLADLLCWAREYAVSTIASCLAAHAALLAFDGVARRALPSKLSGLYPQAVAVDHGLTVGLGEQVLMPHSRRNDVPTEALIAHGYRSLIGSTESGWTVAVRDDGDHRLVLTQGHPEYDVDTLLLEFRRDVRRFVAGERSAYPDEPAAYFRASAAPLLEELRQSALAGHDVFPTTELSPLVRGGWQDPSRLLYANWLSDVSRRARSRISV